MGWISSILNLSKVSSPSYSVDGESLRWDLAMVADAFNASTWEVEQRREV